MFQKKSTLPITKVGSSKTVVKEEPNGFVTAVCKPVTYKKKAELRLK